MFAPPASAPSASAQMRSSAAPEAVGSFVERPRRVDRVRAEDVRLDLAQPLELVVAQDRVLDDELARMLRRLVEQVVLGADARLHAHDDRLANRVDGRVRHLREELLEVRVEERLARGEDGERRVVAHRPDRLLGVARERREHDRHVLLRVAEQKLPAAERLRRRGRLHARRREVGQVPDVLLVPARVRPLPRDARLELVVGDDPPLVEVDEEELPGLQASLAHDRLRRVGEHARLGGEHDPAVRGLVPAARGGARCGRASRR